jgi:hypothetical protein
VLRNFDSCSSLATSTPQSRVPRGYRAFPIQDMLMQACGPWRPWDPPAMGVAHLFAGGPFGHACFEASDSQSRALPKVPAPRV